MYMVCTQFSDKKVRNSVNIDVQGLISFFKLISLAVIKDSIHKLFCIDMHI